MVYLQGGVGTLKYDLLTWLGRDSSALSHYRVGYGVFTVASMQVWVGPFIMASLQGRVGTVQHGLLTGVVRTVQHGLLTGWGRDCSAWSTYGVG